MILQLATDTSIAHRLNETGKLVPKLHPLFQEMAFPYDSVLIQNPNHRVSGSSSSGLQKQGFYPRRVGRMEVWKRDPVPERPDITEEYWPGLGVGNYHFLTNIGNNTQSSQVQSGQCVSQIFISRDEDHSIEKRFHERLLEHVEGSNPSFHARLIEDASNPSEAYRQLLEVHGDDGWFLKSGKFLGSLHRTVYWLDAAPFFAEAVFLAPPDKLGAPSFLRLRLHSPIGEQTLVQGPYFKNRFEQFDSSLHHINFENPV